MQQVLASLQKQTERADKLEAELQSMASHRATLDTAVTQLHSILGRLSSTEESLAQAHTSLSSLTNHQHAHATNLATHHTALAQYGVTLKELQTNASLVSGMLERKAEASEVDKKASAVKVAQVERMALQQAQEVERLRERVRECERDCEATREQAGLSRRVVE